MTIIPGYLSLTGVTFFIFCVFAIAAIGYALGRITIKGVSLGTAGVFIIALLFGCFFYNMLGSQLLVKPADVTFVSSALKIVETMGLMFFVTAVGFIAGPNFVGNFKKNFKSYVLLGLIIIIAGGLTCIVCNVVGRNLTDLSPKEFTAMMVGLLSGSLTSTPAFSASKAAVGESYESIVAVGYGISYLFGVIGVVLFVQLIPKLTKVDMSKERNNIKVINTGNRLTYKGKLIHMDEFGIMPFSVAVVLGAIIGSIKFGNFSLTTTGGCLLVSLVFGHFAHFGPINVTPSSSTLKVFRELGLMFFLIGAGVSGGESFVKYFDPIFFVYGILMTLIPMIIGYLFAKYVLKLSLLNNLGSITGGMTSTPALGTLINVAGTEDVANAYAATYPIALISVVIVSQVIIMLF